MIYLLGFRGSGCDVMAGGQGRVWRERAVPANSGGACGLWDVRFMVLDV